MDKAYDHKKYEDKIYKLWEESEAFKPSDTKKTFTIIMPPPNANDPLHIGHALFVTLEDIMIRFHRMKGFSTLWLPGTDHAGIETQYVFEKKLAKEDKSRFDFDRETLYKKIWDYVQDNSDTAIDQIKKLGASADWSRYKFTLDKDIVKDVIETFKQMHGEGLVYRDVRLVNYSPADGTSFSELEIEYQEKVDPLYFIKYRFADNPDETISVATVRPETIFVDTHLAVHPKDKKRNHLIGKKVLNPTTDAEMEIIGDEFVEPEFGTGIVKLTPAHDQNDFDAGKRHGLPVIQAIDIRRKITDNGGKYSGMKVLQAREEVVKDLQEKGLIEKIQEDYSHRVAVYEKSGKPIEPLPLPQFFVKVKPLTEKVLQAIDKGEVKVLGAGYDKILRQWLENLHDWNISRQIVWGIRMPVWYSTAFSSKITVSFIDKNKETQRGILDELQQKYTLQEIKDGLQSLSADVDVEYVISDESPGEDYIQETDTFDTWFSSSQWPFVTLQNTQPDDFERFYPTDVMETAYDILMFWVMRMLMMGVYKAGKVPFHTVYLHGLIRDEKGQKMSKSKGNVINPIDVGDKYGMDALRMALVIRSTAGLDKNVGEQDIKAMRNFSNKIWNASRFVEAKAKEQEDKSVKSNSKDTEFIEKLQKVTADVTKQIEQLKLGLAADTVYNEFWHWFCDECIEQAKSGEISMERLEDGLKTFLKLLHPFMPFVTEAIWSQELKLDTGLLIQAEWPK